MAYCAHCGLDRPIVRRAIGPFAAGECPFCLSTSQHQDWCRAAGLPGSTLPACAFCEEILFIKARDQSDFESMAHAEALQRSVREAEKRKFMLNLLVVLLVVLFVGVPIFLWLFGRPG